MTEQSPLRMPLLVGWVGGPLAEKLLLGGELFVLNHALESLARILGVPQRRIEGLLEESYTHDWQADLFTRGAYIYIPVGGLDAQAMLAQPVDDTLFFAGEATNVEGTAEQCTAQSLQACVPRRRLLRVDD